MSWCVAICEQDFQMMISHGIATTEGFSRNRPARIYLRRLETELGQRTTEKNQIKSVWKWTKQCFCTDVIPLVLNIDNIVHVDFTSTALNHTVQNAYSVLLYQCDVIETSMRNSTKVCRRSFRRAYSVSRHSSRSWRVTQDVRSQPRGGPKVEGRG